MVYMVHAAWACNLLVAMCLGRGLGEAWEHEPEGTQTRSGVPPSLQLQGWRLPLLHALAVWNAVACVQ